jgi:hypothetical protein
MPDFSGYPIEKMSQRFCLFYAGYTASAPTLYFNKMALLNNWLPEENKQNNIQRLSQQVQDLNYESISSIKTAISIADHFKVDVLPAPDFPEDYFKWLKDYTHAFEDQFPLTRIEHYYFFYSQKIAEILAHVGMISTLSELAVHVQQPESILKQIDKYLSETEFLIFKNKAATALLSSEPRHSYFRTLYNEINTNFEQFKTIKVSELKDTDLQELRKSMETFKFSMLSGFKKCIVLLKDLGV